MVTLPNSMVVRVMASKVQGIDPDGKLSWSLSLEANERAVGNLAAAPNSVIYLRTNNGLRAISPNGQWLWRAPLPAASADGDPAPYSPAALTDSTPVVLVQRQTYRSYDLKGQKRWEVRLQDEEKPRTAPRASADGHCYVGTDASLYQISSDGLIGWRKAL
jgi:outer membrane protein assembly factor BamB